MKRKVAIAGIVGVPGRYGGFETLTENLVHYHAAQMSEIDLTVFCSARSYPEQPSAYQQARLEYVNLDANGVQSIPFDTICLWRSMRQGHDDVILLGVSGAIMLPIVRMLSKMQIITNIDGIEWKREKWSGFARWFLRMSEKIAVRWSHVVIADNAAIADHVTQTYGTKCEVIAYGGDHAVRSPTAPSPIPLPELPERFALALCRIEPENNVEMILEAWSDLAMNSEDYAILPLVFVGNWSKSGFGKEMKNRFDKVPNILLLDPIYDPAALYEVRRRAKLYVHGHSAGGTNPSLVEMMHFGVPVLAHGCSFNRYSTEEQASYFLSATELREAALKLFAESGSQIGMHMQEIAQRRYTWDRIGEAYFKLVSTQISP